MTETEAPTTKNRWRVREYDRYGDLDRTYETRQDGETDENAERLARDWAMYRSQQTSEVSRTEVIFGEDDGTDDAVAAYEGGNHVWDWNM